MKFGDIYVGENLKCYVGIHNEGYHPAKNITIKVELLSNQNRNTIFDLSSSPLQKLDASSFYDTIVEYPLSESESNL